MDLLSGPNVAVQSGIHTFCFHSPFSAYANCLFKIRHPSHPTKISTFLSRQPQMAESKPDQTTHFLSDEVKAPNLFERAKEEIEAILHSEKSPQHHEETHGKRNDIDANTPLDAVRAPNVFERAKEELEALVQTIHPREETTKTESKQDEADSQSENNIQGPNFIEKAKEKIEAITPHHKSSHYHHKETHGTSDDIDEKTPIYDVKGPNVFHRAKEEIEAVIETIHPKKDHTSSVSSPKNEGGFRFYVGRMLEKVCSPQGSKRD